MQNPKYKRKINPALNAWFDAKLKNNGLFQHAMKERDSRMLFILAVESCVGVIESGGDNQGPMVELFQSVVGGVDKEPWCLSLIQACLCYAEIRSGLMSPLPATESTLDLWLTSPQTQRVKLRPARGAIAVWNFTGTKLGHCGMFLEFFGRHMVDFKTIEGNTHDGLGFVREGNGVFLRERSLKSPEGFELLGFLKPF